MSETSTSKACQEPVAIVRTERGRFGPGGPSANPKGRPPRGETLAEQWRRSTDWNAVRQRLEDIVMNKKSRDADAIAAARELTDRAWGKAPIDVTLRPGNSAPTEDFSHLPVEERREKLAKVRALIAELRGDQPDHTDEEPNESIARDLRLHEPRATDDNAP